MAFVNEVTLTAEMLNGAFAEKADASNTDIRGGTIDAVVITNSIIDEAEHAVNSDNATHAGSADSATNASNANQLLGKTWSVPPVIGQVSPNDANFLALNANGINSQTLTVATANPTLYYKRGGVSAIDRTYKSKFDEIFSVKDKGAIGDGIASDFQSFAWAHTDAPAGVPIRVPPGNYLLDSTVSCPGRVWILEGATLTGAGKLDGGLIYYTDPSTGFRKNGVGNPYQFGARYAYGGNHHGPCGLQVGGGDLTDGDQGVVHFADGYSGWETLAPTSYPGGAIEFAVQPGAIAGTCNPTSGSNVVTSTSGGAFLPGLVGKRIYIGVDQRYTIASYISATGITVKNLDGSAVSFASSTAQTYVVAYCKGTGTCNTSGTAVTRVKGDPFLLLGNADDKMIINGVSYQQTGSLPDQDHMTLTTSAGTQTGVPYEFFTTVDDLVSAIRVHRVSGAGFEENLTIGAYGPGYFHFHAASGTSRQYQMRFGAGYSAGSKRNQLILDGNDGHTEIAPGLGICTDFTRRPVVSSFFVSFAGGGSEYGASFRPYTDNTSALYFANAAGTSVGSIVTTSSATSFNTASDPRLKKDLAPLTGSGEFIDSLKLWKGKWRADDSDFVGMLAPEVQAVSSSSVFGEKDAVDDNGAPIYQSVAYASPDIMANIIAELQSLRKRVAAIEEKS